MNDYYRKVDTYPIQEESYKKTIYISVYIKLYNNTICAWRDFDYKTQIYDYTFGLPDNMSGECFFGETLRGKASKF